MTETDSAEARASQEATDWFLLLREEPDDAELRTQFETWQATDPRNAAAWAVTQRTTDIMAQVPPVQVISTAASPSRGADILPFGRRSSIRLFVGSAVAACLGLWFLPGLLVTLQADFSTTTAEVRTEPLDDGSVVTLAPESAVEIIYDGAQRRINVLKGEAFFSVRDPKGRPFRVVANGVTTTDLGTAFSVQRTSSGAAIVVASGSVRVDFAGGAGAVSEVLGTGQSIRVARTAAAVRGEREPAQVATWRQKQLIAQDEPIRDIVEQLRPYFGGQIILADAELADRRVSGVYNIADPANALRGIAEARGAVVRQVSPWLLIVSGR